MRESYRLGKPGLYDSLPKGKTYHLALIYSGTEILDFPFIQKSLTQAFEKWLRELTKESSLTETGSVT